MTSCRTERDCYSNEIQSNIRLLKRRQSVPSTKGKKTKQKARPFDYCCSHQSVASPPVCLCQGSQWTYSVTSCLLVRAHSGHFEHIFSVFVVQCVKLMLRIFETKVLLFCLSPKCNLSETFFHVWALRR